MVQTRVYSDRAAMAFAAGDLVLKRILAALEASRRAAIVLSGGATPRETYRLLARAITDERVPVKRLLWILADERWVPVTHPGSNEGMIREALLAPIGAPEDSILSWQAGSGDPVERADRYGTEVSTRMAGGDRPDILVLGMGADGHTASLFPGATAILSDGRRMAVCADIPGVSVAVLRRDGTWRLSLCPRFMNTARLAAFLVADAQKREKLKAAQHRDPDVPASWIRGEETLFLTTREVQGDGTPDLGGEVRFA